MTIYTVGHSTRSLEELAEILSAWKIELLADVRSLPGSRKFPQFNLESLETALPQDVFHILSATKGQEHQLTGFAKIKEGRVIYP